MSWMDKMAAVWFHASAGTKVLFIFALVIVLGASAKLAHNEKNKARIAYKKMQKEVASRMEGFVHQDAHTGVRMPYLLYRPKVESSKPLPLVIAMHSGRGRGSDNVSQVDHSIQILLSEMLQGVEPVMVLAPQADVWTHWVDYDSFKPPFENFDQREIPESDNVKTAMNILRKVIAEYAVDRERVYITGISMGGEGTWDALTYYPELFAASIVLNGAADPRALPRVGMLPIRYFHGSADTITPVANSREIAEAFKAFPNRAEYHEFDGGGHDIRNLVYSRELFEWMLEQRLSQRESSDLAEGR